MKAQFLKIAGVKTDKEFYDKYPTEEVFFAKCGAKIKKAFPKAQFGAVAGASSSGFGSIASSAAQTGMANNSGGSGFMQNITGGGKGVGGFLKNITGGDPMEKVLKTIEGFKAQKEKVNQANQTAQTMNWFEDAALSNKQYEGNELQQARMKGYVGGDREKYGMTGEELFPMYGVGTNVLAKDGKMVKAQPKYQNGGSMGSSGGGTPWGALISEMAGPAVNYGMQQLKIGGDDMGSQIGGDVLEKVGAATGIPGLSLVGKVVGSGIGDAIDKSDSKIERYNKQSENSMNNMIGMNVGKNIQGRFAGNLKDGGTIQYAEGGNLQMIEPEGSFSHASSNPYGGDQYNINGPSHKEGGTDIIANGQRIEAENEPVYSNQEGDMVILGDLKPADHLKKSAESFTGEKITGSKYKQMGVSIGKIEKKYTDKMEKINESINPNPLRSLDLIEKASKERMSKIFDGKLKKLQVVKDGLSVAQEAQNTEDNKSAQKGKTITSKEKQSYLDKGYIQDPKNDMRLYKDGTDPVKVKGTPDIEGETVTTPGAAPIKDTYDGSGGYANDEDWNAFLKTPKGQAYTQKYNTGTPENVSELGTEGIRGFNDWEMPGTPGDEIFIEDPLAQKSGVTKLEGENEKEPFNWLGGANYLPSDAEGFNNGQLLPEAWAMANNQLEPVQAQKFNPRLRVPYDISFQDQMNETTAKARGAERMAAYNPGQLANLKAQEYMADQNVLGSQFRQNQQFKDQVYSGNLNTINDAELKNLAIADTQYVRQAQAKSNTKATEFEAIKSMTDKRLKHNLENQTLRVWENMYKYRYDADGTAQYRGPAADVSGWEAVNTEPINQEIYDYEKGPDGKLMRQKKTKSAPTKKPSTATPSYVAMNGSIVKQIKKFK